MAVISERYPGQPNRQAWEDAIRASPHDSTLYQRYKVASAANFSVVYAPSPVNTGPALPPRIETIPNPLADVNPSPAQNRNPAIPKTGAVLPFPNPNQPQVDLATPKGVLPGTPSVVGGVTADAVSSPRVDYADLWWASQARKDITYEQYKDAIYGRNSLSRWTLPPVGGLPPVVPQPPGGGFATPPYEKGPPPTLVPQPPVGGLPPVALPVASSTTGVGGPQSQPNRQSWEDAIRADLSDTELFKRYLAEAEAGFPRPYTPGSATGGGLPPVVGGGTAVQLTSPGGAPTKSPGAPPAGSGAETPEEELRRLQRELTALQLAGEDDPGYEVSAGTAVRIRAIQDRMAQLFNQPPAPPPSSLPPTPPTGIIEGAKEKFEKVADWIANLPSWLRAVLRAPTGGILDAVGQFGEVYVKKLTDEQIEEALTALTGAPGAEERLQELRDEQTRRSQVKTTSEAETSVKTLGLDAYGVTAEEFARYTPDQFLQLYNTGGSKMTDARLRGLLETWQKQNPGQKIPVPTDKNSRAYQFYQTMKTVGKADALFAPEAAGPAGTVTPQQITDYVNRLRSSTVLPKTADEAYDWLQKPLEPPPGLVDTDRGWLNADGSPPTPEQQQALNAYESRLRTQSADREAAYKLIAARDGQATAEEALKAAEWRAEEARKAAEWRAEEARKAGDVRAEEGRKAADARAVQAGVEAERRLESRTISAEQRAEATKIAAEGRAAAARLMDEARQEGRVTAAEQRAIQAGIDAEKRLESRTLSAEQRAEATRIAGEGRAIQAGIAEEGRAIKAGIDAEKRLESRTLSAEQRAEATKIAAEGRAISAGIEAERRLESRTLSAEQRAEAAQTAKEGRAATTRIKERASGGAPASAEATASYRASLRGFTAVPTTLEEAKGWLGQTLPAPPGLTYDATTNQWVDESGNLPTGDRAQAVQDYEFQQSQYGKNRERADAIVKSYADLDAVQRGRDAAEAALQRALGTKDVLEQVELTYRLDKAELDLKETQRKSQMIQAYVALTNNPSTAARMKSLGLLDQFNRDTGMNVTVPDKVSKDKVFAMIPSLGDWANMSPQQQMDALEMLSARTGWMPEELAALMSEVAGAPGGFRGGSVSSSTVARSR